MILLALVFAVMLNSQRVRFRGFFRTVYFLPVVTSLVITGLIFSFLFSSSFGLVNRLLEPLGIAPINWLADPTWMKPVLILALLWRWTGNDMVIMLAGLQSIPADLYEAARVDGASGPQMFWHITVPLMRPVILFDAIISTIGTFNLFAEPFVLFGPGRRDRPGRAGHRHPPLSERLRLLQVRLRRGPRLGAGDDHLCPVDDPAEAGQPRSVD